MNKLNLLGIVIIGVFIPFIAIAANSDYKISNAELNQHIIMEEGTSPPHK